MELPMIIRSTKLDPRQTETNRTIDTQFIDDLPFNWRLTLRPHSWRPPTDLYETEDAVIVRVEISGMRESDFSIELNGRILSIRGIRQDVPERRAYHQMEIRFGEFNIDMELNTPIEPGLVEATYNAGFLRIKFPKAQPRQVLIHD
jgi:HSP20 family protein